MSNIIWLTKNNLKVTFKKRGTYIVFFILPVIFISIVTFMNNSQKVGSVRIGIVDKDKSKISEDLITSLVKQDNFTITQEEDLIMDKDLARGKLDCVMLIPRGFQESVYDNYIKQLEVKSVKGETATAWINNYLNTYMENIYEVAEISQENKESFQKLYTRLAENKLNFQVVKVKDDQHNKSMSQTSMGFLIMFMLMCAGNATEMILKEKKNRTYYRICSSNINARNYILANVLASIIILGIQILFTLFMITKVFRMNTFISFGSLFGMLLIFGLVAIGFGLMIVAFSDDSKVANGLKTLIITPSCMLGGCYWPISIMPESVQRVSDFIPQRWVMGAIEKLQKGQGLNDVLLNITIILGFAATFFVVAVYKFNRNENIKTFV